VLVACTQETKLFLELTEETEGAPSVAERPIRFVNIRESGGWSKDAAAALPKMAALIAAAQLPPAEPVPIVGYRSGGRVLVIGAADVARRAARMLADKLEVIVARKHITARRERTRDHAHGLTLDQSTGRQGGCGECDDQEAGQDGPGAGQCGHAELEIV